MAHGVKNFGQSECVLIGRCPARQVGRVVLTTVRAELQIHVQDGNDLCEHCWMCFVYKSNAGRLRELSYC